MPRLGELLVEQNLVSQEKVNIALRLQVGGNRRLGYILVKMKAISADKLAELLSKQLDIPITDLAQNFSPEPEGKNTPQTKKIKILPRYLCRQYGVLPLALKDNNILLLAMSNPSDNAAISDLEKYTGKVIEPRLALLTEIEKEISRRIPLGWKDIFTPRTNTLATRTIAIASLFLAIGLGIFTYDYIDKSRHGTISTTESQVLFKHLDLMLGVDKAGAVTILGQGAFSKGFYNVTFQNAEALKAFLKSKEKDFSAEQREWLGWAINQTALLRG